MTRPPYSLYRVVAEHVEWVTPRMKRIVIDGSCLAAFRVGLPAQWLKVFVPTHEGRAHTGRAYTVRRFDPRSKKLELDFVLHGDNGLVSAWAARVKPGDSFEISATHPRSGLAIQGSTEHYLLLGDETALPAIGGILEALPAHARAEVFVEVDGPRDEQTFETAAAVQLHWLHREGGGRATSASLLEEAARALARPGDNTVLWIAAESSIVQSLRKQALSEWGIDRQRLHAVGYWKRGESNHKDEEASERGASPIQAPSP